MINSFVFLPFIGVVFGLSAPATNQVDKNARESKVIFFSGANWKSECYVANDPSKQCVWFSLGEGGFSYANLHDLTTTYRRVYNCRNVGGYDNQTKECDTSDETIHWDFQIRSIYISDPNVVVVLYDEPDFQGNSFRVWGGGFDLTQRGWGDRARSVKVFFQ